MFACVFEYGVCLCVCVCEYGVCVCVCVWSFISYIVCSFFVFCLFVCLFLVLGGEGVWVDGLGHYRPSNQNSCSIYL